MCPNSTRKPQALSRQLGMRRTVPIAIHTETHETGAKRPLAKTGKPAAGRNNKAPQLTIVSGLSFSTSSSVQEGQSTKRVSFGFRVSSMISRMSNSMLDLCQTTIAFNDSGFARIRGMPLWRVL